LNNKAAAKTIQMEFESILTQLNTTFTDLKLIRKGSLTIVDHRIIHQNLNVRKRGLNKQHRTCVQERIHQQNAKSNHNQRNKTNDPEASLSLYANRIKRIRLNSTRLHYQELSRRLP